MASAADLYSISSTGPRLKLHGSYQNLATAVGAYTFPFSASFVESRSAPAVHDMTDLPKIVQTDVTERRTASGGGIGRSCGNRTLEPFRSQGRIRSKGRECDQREDHNYQEGEGKTGALNTAIKNIKTPYFVLLGGDCTYGAKDITRLFPFIHNSPEVIRVRSKGRENITAYACVVLMI